MYLKSDIASFLFLFILLLWADNWQLVVAEVIFAHKGPDQGFWMGSVRMVLHNQLQRVALCKPQASNNLASICGDDEFCAWGCRSHSDLVSGIPLRFCAQVLFRSVTVRYMSKWSISPRNAHIPKKGAPQTSAMSFRLHAYRLQTTLQWLLGGNNVVLFHDSLTLARVVHRVCRALCQCSHALRGRNEDRPCTVATMLTTKLTSDCHRVT